MKSVEIRSFFWSVFSCIMTEYGNLLFSDTSSVKLYYLITKQNLTNKYWWLEHWTETYSESFKTFKIEKFKT